MISIVLDGRNDAHGGNSHKRVAISLNCLASVLADDDDEIVFVDYNSPDDVPTFPEAIEDLLTPRARARLRILRVRPDIHRRLAMPGAGVLLDVIARNVGLRRTNASNRWVLSTTSDIVVVPRQAGHSLTEICRDLPDGFYALPRFEMPEFLWEATDRHDPEAIKLQFAAWGQRFHLNEAVLGVPEVVFDACGDFQLFLRNDAFAIGGFDERMIAGWQHSDASLQRRLGLLHGGVTDFSGRAFAYHCDHMRQAAEIHRGHRIENDWDLFVASIRRPELAFQLSDWGLAEEEIAEIRLPSNRMKLIVSALSDAIDVGSVEPSVVSRDHSAFDRATVPEEHVLPFLADHLSTLPQGAGIMFVGSNPALLRSFARTVVRLDGRVVLSVDPAPLDDEMRAELDALPFVTVIESVRAPEGCRICFFDFSVHRLTGADQVFATDLSEAELSALARIRRLFLEETARERERMKRLGSRRKFVVVNAVHTAVETMVADELEAALTPFSTRIRHGYVRSLASPPRSLDSLLHELTGQAGRAVDLGELSLILSIISSCRRGQAAREIPGWAITRGLQATLELPWFVSACRLKGTTLDALRARCEEVLEGQARPGAAPPEERAGSRLCDLRDWDNPAWRQSARRVSIGAERTPPQRRHRSTWERIQMFHVASTAQVLRADARVAVVSANPDELAVALAGEVGSLDLIRHGASKSSPAWQTLPASLRRGNVRVLEQGWAELRNDAPKYNAIFVPQNTAFLNGERSIDEITGFAERFLVERGLLIFSAEYVIRGGGTYPWWGGDDPAESAAIARALENSGAFRVLDLPATSPSPETMASRATLAEALQAKAHGILEEGSHLRTSSIWVCQRTAASAGRGRHRLGSLLLLDRNLLPRAEAAKATHWQGRSLIVDCPGSGMVARIPNLSLPPGPLRVVLHVVPGERLAPIVVEVVSGFPLTRGHRRKFIPSEIGQGQPVTLDVAGGDPWGRRREIRIIAGGPANFAIDRMTIGWAS